MKFNNGVNENSVVLETWEELFNFWNCLQNNGQVYKLTMFKSGNGYFTEADTEQLEFQVDVQPLQEMNEIYEAKEDWKGSVESRNYKTNTLLNTYNIAVNYDHILNCVKNVLDNKSSSMCIHSRESIVMYLTIIENIIKSLGCGDQIDYVKDNYLYMKNGSFIAINKMD